MIEQRVMTLTSRKIKESHRPERDLELYELVLDLARWGIIFWVNLRDRLHKVPCPNCMFPSRLARAREGKIVMLEMTGDGDFRCLECNLRIKNPPQLAWVLLVSKVCEEYEREKHLQSEGRDPG